MIYTVLRKEENMLFNSNREDLDDMIFDDEEYSVSSK